MKKMLALLLAAVMVLSMAACAAAPATTPADTTAPKQFSKECWQSMMQMMNNGRKQESAGIWLALFPFSAGILNHGFNAAFPES